MEIVTQILEVKVNLVLKSSFYSLSNLRGSKLCAVHILAFYLPIEIKFLTDAQIGPYEK